MSLDLEGKTIFGLVKTSSLRSPKSMAIEDPDRRPLCYDELLDRLRYSVRYLNGCGLSRNDRVAVILPNGPEMAVTFLGVSSCATCAPINPQINAEELRFLLRDMRAKALVFSPGVDSRLLSVVDELGIRRIMLTPDAGLAGRYRLDGGQLVDSGEVYASPGDTALILHTSGTTARPKMVPLTHLNLSLSARNISESLALTADDRCLNVMPLFHIHGLIGCLLSNIAVGATTICSRGYQAEEFFDLLYTLRPTWYSAVPSMHQAILIHGREGDDRVQHNLRFIRSCSAALPRSVMEELESFFGVPVVEAYGMTEASHQIAVNPLPPNRRKPGSVGLASGVEVSIMSEGDEMLPAGELGEVVIRGPTVTKGYEGNPEANARAFIDGWFKTGDQGYIDSEGYIFLTDRIKDIINRGGEKVSPREVDEALLSYPSVSQAVTFPMPDDRLGEEVAAAVVVKENREVTEWEIQRHVATRLSSYKVPRRLFFVDEIPKGPTGKIQRKTIAKRLMNESTIEEPSPRTEYAAPTNEVENALVEIWSKVLKIEKIGIRDDYFALGGDSLRAEEIVTLISKRLGIRRIPIVIFIHAPTIERMAIMLSSEVADLSSILVCMQPNGDKAPIYIIHPCDGEVIRFTNLVYNLGKQRPIYAFRAPFLNGEKIPDRAIEEYSSRYLEELLKKQAEGPHILVGVGPGALIALEMARRLGDPEVKVILIEALHPKSILNMDARRLADRLLEIARSIPNQVLLSVREGHLMSLLAKGVEKLSIAVVASRSNITRMNRVVKQYDPVEYLSPVLLFMAQTRMDYPPDPSARINQLLLFLKGEVETHVIQGEHMRILNEPGARRIAEIINKYINE
jgi:acyl-CoA synthetase (AMP-forming)/AMP-acid ligase II/thioesterase domain-containing protein